MLKIISGKFAGRKINTSKKHNYRPSTTKFREALFSILSSGIFLDQNILENSKVLDLYCGTGSLSFEAISRGAQSATLIDNDLDHLNLCKQTAEELGIITNLAFLRCNATNLPYASKRYNLVFMDPPYQGHYIAKSLKSLHKSIWLEENALIIIDLDKRYEYELPKNFTLLDERIYSKSKLHIISYHNEQKE